MDKIVIASGNPGKLKEIQSMLRPLGINVVRQSELNVPEVDETGLTFVENAILKARQAAEYTGLPALADDSGLEVDALQQAPGIYSARFAGLGLDGSVDCTDEANNARLVRELSSLPELNPFKARYQCVVAFMRHSTDPTPIVCSGSWEGEIRLFASGDGGFGYDPYFYIPKLSCTAAELPADKKNNISHRGVALAQFISALTLSLKQ